MNLHTVLTPARKILVSTAVTLVAASCLGSATSASAATAGHDRSDSTSATKEWKAATTLARASRTKEW